MDRLLGKPQIFRLDDHLYKKKYMGKTVSKTDQESDDFEDRLFNDAEKKVELVRQFFRENHGGVESMPVDDRMPGFRSYLLHGHDDYDLVYHLTVSHGRAFNRQDDDFSLNNDSYLVEEMIVGKYQELLNFLDANADKPEGKGVKR